MKSLREAYGRALVEAGRNDKRIIALDADLGKSTFSRSLLELGEERFVEAGIAEQNMAAIAAGLALAGKVPFMSSFAVFSTGRCYDQIRSSICIPRLNVNICGSSAGLSDYGDGKTHQSVDDLALMRVLPGMTVLVPVDANQVYGMVEAMAKAQGPAYLRIPRNDLPLVTERGEYELGSVDELKSGSDLTILSCGATVHTALEAAVQLDKQGISAGVASLGTVKPFPTDKVRKLAEKTGAVLIAEEHSLIGGLGEAVMGALAGRTLIIDHMGLDDTFGQSAESYEALLEHYGMTATHMADRAVKLLGGK